VPTPLPVPPPTAGNLPLPTPDGLKTLPQATGGKQVETPLPVPPVSPKPSVAPAPHPLPPQPAVEARPMPLPSAPALDKEPIPARSTQPPGEIPPVTDLVPKKDTIKPPVVVNEPAPAAQVLRPSVPALDPMPIKPAAAYEPIKLKGSAWSLYVEMVDGRSVVTATVNKKHEFKIVCQTLDLQTVAGCMKAKGKVTITGDCLTGTCDQLTLPLHDDRLLLEGMADVRIQKVTTNTSDTNPSAFELKGDKLDLRISELQSSTFTIEGTAWRKVSGEASETRPVRAVSRGTSNDTAQSWTQYGTLRAQRSSNDVWTLNASNGDIIAYVMPRDGGTLDQYVGRTIAVFGGREGERAGRPLVRVTHIAVP
jgi:hypothetical protein